MADIGKKIHDRIVEEHGVPLHHGDHTYIVHVYNYNLRVQHNNEDRKEAARFFWDTIASEELKKMIADNIEEWKDYCAELRQDRRREEERDAEFNSRHPSPGIGSYLSDAQVARTQATNCNLTVTV